MNKFVFLLLTILSFISFASNQDDVARIQQQALEAMKGFNPGSILKDYTPSPKEALLQPSENNNPLPQAGLQALQNNKDALDVYYQANTREKAAKDSNSSEMQYAEKLLENPEQVLEGDCFRQAASCINQNVIKTCQETVSYQACKEKSSSLCPVIAQSFCQVYLNASCQQTGSQCVKTFDNRCSEFLQTFQCQQKVCRGVKTICPSKMACVDGSCDETTEEASDDIQEGLSRLGALGGVSSEISSHPGKGRRPVIFKGTSYQCEKYPLGFRDCCKDSGWGDWVKSCPKELQDLQQAKKDNRVVYVGKYKKHKLGSKYYVYCIFPTKLSAIIQIQGRGNQLHIPYGTAELPNCRGITPQELERINFSALDLSSIEQELMARMVLPNNGQITTSNQAKVERLKQENRPHD